MALPVVEKRPIPRILSTTVVYSAVCHCIPILLALSFQSQNYVTTDGQSASLSWSKAPINALPGNGSVKTVQHAAIERDYATRF
jgi:hypothetical protein